MEGLLLQKRLAKLAVVLLAIGPMRSSGQTAKDLSGKFSPVAAYLAGPDIVVFVDFDESGRACQAIVEKRVYQTSGANGASLLIPGAVAKSIVDQIAPVAERGRPLSPYFAPESVITGGTYHLKSDYGNVSIETIGTTGNEDGIEAVKIKWVKRTCSPPRSMPSAATVE
jgi:hypothetical protein